MSEPLQATNTTPENNTPHGVAPGSVRVVERDHHFQRDIYSDRHHLLADEPLGHHGSDQGFDPYELLLASLGACTSMTVRMYANHKQWPLDDIEVRLHHEKTSLTDAQGVTQTIDQVRREVILRGPLTEEQRTRLLDVANKCPVHKTLTGQLRIGTALVDTGDIASAAG